MNKRRTKVSVKPFGRGALFIVSGPSGVGKTTLCQKLSSSVSHLKHSVSYTTRPPRKCEINNVHYTFIDKKKFKTMIDKREFAEWAVVHGNFYGTSAKKLAEICKTGYDIILDIDTQGATQMKRKYEDAVYIFILPPSMKILEKRLRARMSELTMGIKTRIDRAKGEIANYKNYGYIVVNRDLKKALGEIKAIVTAQRLRTAKVDPKWLKILKIKSQN
ncbi:MAG: guanylate kinase [Candidatus Mariimomonas ferrooxydans]